MSLNLIPDYRFDKFDEVSTDFLLSQNVKGIVLDIDNTLEPYENDKPGERVLRWLSDLSAAGIKTAIVSNNNRQRVETFNEEIGMPAYFKAKKPFKKNVISAINAMGVSAQNAILMGDQIFTDVWAAHNAGIKAILVPPIKDKTDVFTKLKRLLERPLLSIYERRKNDTEF